MRNRTRVLININGANGAQLTENDKAISFRILPDLSSQIEAGKKYLIYLTKLYLYGLTPVDGEILEVNTIISVIIDGLSIETNNLNLNTTVQNLPVVGIATLTKGASTTDNITQVIWENPHPKDDGLICSNPFNNQLKLKLLNLSNNEFFDLSTSKLIIELMIEEFCNC